MTAEVIEPPSKAAFPEQRLITILAVERAPDHDPL
jgi:hypothetical protein